jgi:hypothetical protein
MMEPGKTRSRARVSGKPFALLAAAILALAVPAAGPLRGEAAPESGRQADQAALKAFGSLVGTWRGVGQVERGRTRGAWTESAAWAWKLSHDSAALAVRVKSGKHLASGVLRPGKSPGEFVLDATLPDGATRTFVGKPAAGAGAGNGAGTSARVSPRLVLTAAGAVADDAVARVTITPLHDTRLLVLFEAPDGQGRFRRLGEVGYTREGVVFAAGESYPLCIVTGGRGTTQVQHKGKTYWVCCSGCRDLFNEDPEAVLAEAAAKTSK